VFKFLTLEQKAFFNQKVAFITGASRGIGREVALSLAALGVKIAIVAKTKDPHPKLPGTIESVRAEVAQINGSENVIAIQTDIRDEIAVKSAVDQTVETFGGIDFLINNASAIKLATTQQLSMKDFDLMQQVNVRGTFLCAKYGIPYLQKSSSGRILTFSPPLNLQPKWFKDYLGYSLSKFGMSMCTLGLAEELREMGIAVNALWPKTMIATAAIEFNFPKPWLEQTRKPKIMADAVLCTLSQPNSITGQFLVDELVLQEAGVSDFSDYALNKSMKLLPDIFL
jgi:citronellol/citronellal dehydrogenase